MYVHHCGTVIGVDPERTTTGAVWSIVIVLFMTIEGELGFQAISVTAPERMFILIIPFQVAVIVISNLV